MTTTPPGWYSDPQNPAAQRWWDGSRWTEFTSAWAQVPVDHPEPVAHPAAPARTAPANPAAVRWSWRPTLSTYVVGALAVLISLIGAGTNGLGGFLVGLALFGMGAGIYTLVKRRPSFLNLAPTKQAGGAALGISAALLLVGSLLAPHSAPAPQAADADSVASISSPVAAAPAARPTTTPSPKKSATPTPTPTPTPVVATQMVDVPEPIPYASSSYDEPTLELGAAVTVTAGVPGTIVKRWQITTTDGVETGRTLVSETVTSGPVDEVIAIGSLQPAPPPAPEPAPVPDAGGGCNPNYAGGCVPIDSDVDCPGGSGNGPSYAPGPVQVIGSDIYDLDRDGDGLACD